MAKHIADSDPKIRRVFDQWKGTAALDSPLEKNQDLKAVLIEETPWLRDAAKESESRRNVGILFDERHPDAGAVHLCSDRLDPFASPLGTLTHEALRDGVHECQYPI